MLNSRSLDVMKSSLKVQISNIPSSNSTEQSSRQVPRERFIFTSAGWVGGVTQNELRVRQCSGAGVVGLD